MTSSRQYTYSSSTYSLLLLNRELSPLNISVIEVRYTYHKKRGALLLYSTNSLVASDTRASAYKVEFYVKSIDFSLFYAFALRYSSREICTLL